MKYGRTVDINNGHLAYNAIFLRTRAGDKEPIERGCVFPAFRYLNSRNVYVRVQEGSRVSCERSLRKYVIVAIQIDMRADIHFLVSR